MKTFEVVAKRILQLCDESKLSVNKLGAISGLDTSTISSILYGKSKNPGIRTILDLCYALGISLYDFFNDELFKNKNLEGTY